MIDEGPSPDDLDRFNADQSGYCPECGAEVWDNVEICPKCGLPIGGRVRTRPPSEQWLRQRWILLVIIVLVALLSGAVALVRVLGP